MKKWNAREAGQIATWCRWHKGRRDKLPQCLLDTDPADWPDKVKNALAGETKNENVAQDVGAVGTAGNSDNHGDFFVSGSDSDDGDAFPGGHLDMVDAAASAKIPEVVFEPVTLPDDPTVATAAIFDAEPTPETAAPVVIPVRQTSIDACVSAVDVVVTAASADPLSTQERTLWNDAIHATLEDFGIARIPGLILLAFAGGSSWAARSERIKRIWRKTVEKRAPSTNTSSLASSVSTPRQDMEKPSVSADSSLPADQERLFFG